MSITGYIQQGNVVQLTDSTGRSCETLLQAVNCFADGNDLTIISSSITRTSEKRSTPAVLGHFAAREREISQCLLSQCRAGRITCALVCNTDQTEKLPYAGVFTSLSQMEERFEFRKQILDDVQSKSLERSGVEVGKNTRLLQLQLRESEHLAEKLSQTVSDLTTVLYLKEAELQYWQSRVSHYRQEALTLAKGSNTLKATLSGFEYTIECQSKELAALRTEQKGLKEAFAQALREKDELLQRWMEEKREEADRLNKYNDAQERWQRLAKQLKKHLHREMGKEYVPIATSCLGGTTETSPSVMQSINNTAETQQTHSDLNVSAVAKV